MGVKYVPAELLRRVELEASSTAHKWAEDLQRASGRTEDARRSRLRHLCADFSALVRRTGELLDGLDSREVATMLDGEEP